MLTRHLHMPYPVGLVFAGIALYFLSLRLNFRLSSNLIYSGFMPPPVFEAALYIRWSESKKDLPIVGLLATLGVFLAATITAIGMHYVVVWNWDSAIVFGVLIAATDPVTVIATFREAGLQGRIRLLVESESLLNDGTAAALFAISISTVAGQNENAIDIGKALILTIGGGVGCGFVTGFAMMFLAGRTKDRFEPADSKPHASKSPKQCCGSGMFKIFTRE